MRQFTYIYWFIIKGIIKDTYEQLDEEAHWDREGWRVLSVGTSVHGLWGAPPSWRLDVFTNPQVLQTPSFRVFMEVPIHGCDWLGFTVSLAIVINSVPGPSSPWRLGDEAESSNPLITRLVPLATSSHSEAHRGPTEESPHWHRLR